MFRRLIVLAGRCPARCVAASAPALAVRVKVRVEGKTTTIFGAPSRPSSTRRRTRSTRSTRPARPASSTTTCTSTSFGPYVDQIGRYPARRASGWVFKVNGVSPPVGADQATLKDGDTVLWYWATFTDAGGPPTLAPRKRKRAELLPGRLARTTRAVDSAAGARSCASTGGASQTPRRPGAASASTAASSARRCRRRCARTRSVNTCPRSPPSRSSCSPAAGTSARAGERDALGHARPRREVVLDLRRCRPG